MILILQMTSALQGTCSPALTAKLSAKVSILNKLMMNFTNSILMPMLMCVRRQMESFACILMSHTTNVAQLKVSMLAAQFSK